MTAPLSFEHKMVMSEGHDAASRFHEENPDFDLLNHDFYDPAGDGPREYSDSHDTATVAVLSAQQRVARLTSDPHVARQLIKHRLDSAHAVAQVPRHRFVQGAVEHLEVTQEEAAAIYDRATSIKAAVKHFVTDVRTTHASPHFQAIQKGQIDAQYQKLVDMPNYQSLFGGLNFCACEHCSSIFSPAAYFLDMMRIADDYITDPNTTKASDNIPDDLLLSSRRPDLFNLQLTCSNTNLPIPTLTIANQVMEQVVLRDTQKLGDLTAATTDTATLDSNAPAKARDIIGRLLWVQDTNKVVQTRTVVDYDASTKVATLDQPWTRIPTDTWGYALTASAYQRMAVASYPFNLPANLPLIETRRDLAQIGCHLQSIYAAVSGPVNVGNIVAATVASAQLPKSASKTDGAYTSNRIKIVAGTGLGQSRAIKSYDGSNRTVTTASKWTTVPDTTSAYEIYDIFPQKRETCGLSVEQVELLTTVSDTNAGVAARYGLSSLKLKDMAVVQTFLEISGLDWQGLVDLLVQGLSDQELADKVSGGFFINDTGEPLDPIEIVQDATNPSKPFMKLTNLSLKRLDRITRFVRLHQVLGWSSEALDWVMKSVGAEEITEELIIALSTMKQLTARTGTDIIELTVLWSDIKTDGKGNGPTPADLFDRIYNSPSLLRGQDPYTSSVPIPFDPSRPLTWDYDVPTGADANIRGRLLGALMVSDDDLTLIARHLIKGGSGSGGTTISLTLANLTQMFRVAQISRTLSLSIDAYLVFIKLLELSENDVGTSAVEEVWRQFETAQWFVNSKFDIYTAQYIMLGRVSPYFTPPYKPSDVAPFVNTLATTAQPNLLVPGAFDGADIDTERADLLYELLSTTGFCTDIGVMRNNLGRFLTASAKNELTKRSFFTADIDKTESEAVYAQLLAAVPPVLEKVTNKTAQLARPVSENQRLDYLFPGDENAANKRNQVLSILLSVQGCIAFDELSFAFPLSADAFVNAMISPQQSAAILNDLAAQKAPVVTLDPAGGQQGTIASYDAASRTVTLAARLATQPVPGSLYSVLDTKDTGTAQGAGVTSLTLDAGASNIDSAYVGMTLRIPGPLGEALSAEIVQYDGDTREAKVAPAWDSLPQAGVGYAVYDSRVDGQVLSVSGDEIGLDSNASSNDTRYENCLLEIDASGTLQPNSVSDATLKSLFESTGAGQSASAQSYDGEGRELIVATSWATVPDTTSYYQIIGKTVTGTARAGTNGSIQLATTAPKKDSALQGLWLSITSGTGVGQKRRIYSYDGKSRTATVQRPFDVAPDKTSQYVVKEIITEGYARGGATSSILLAADASTSDKAYDGTTIEIVEQPDINDRVGAVRGVLDAVSAQNTFAATALKTAKTDQFALALRGLADFLSTSEDRLATLIEDASQVSGLVDVLPDLLTPLTAGQVTRTLSDFIKALAQNALLFDTLIYSPLESAAVFEMEDVFGWPANGQLRLENLETLALFKVIVADFSGNSDAVLEYLRYPNTAQGRASSLAALSVVSHWPLDQIANLVEQFWPTSNGDDYYRADTVGGLSRMAAAFDLCDNTQLNISTLLEMQALGRVSVADPSNDTVDLENWRKYSALADVTLGAVKNSVGEAGFTKVYSYINEGLNEAKRDMLIGYTLWILNNAGITLKNSEQLFQFLLIDVNTGGCDQSSYIAQGISAIQLYMQRCRMMLEPGVTDMAQIPEAWWAWMSAYRVWEANRKIFLYPENYITPSLRQGATPQFKTLTETLLSNDVTEATVSQAFQTYFEGFSNVSQLTNFQTYSYDETQFGTSILYDTGTVMAATEDTVTLAASASKIFSYYVGMQIRIVSGTGVGETARITDYNGSNRIATISPKWKTTPDATSNYSVTGNAKYESTYYIANEPTDPNARYWRHYSGLKGWSPWQEITLKAASPYVSPVYAFNKLHLLWTETKLVESTKIDLNASGNPETTNVTTTSVSINISTMDKDQIWSVPYRVAENSVTCSTLGYELDPYVAMALPGWTSLFEPQTYYFWEKLYPVYVREENLTAPDDYPNGGRIVLNFGLPITFQVGGPAMPQIKAPSTKQPASTLQFANDAYQTHKNYNALVQGAATNMTGSTQYLPATSIDSGGIIENLPLTLINGVQGYTYKPFGPNVNYTTGELEVATARHYNLIQTDYLGDSYPNKESFFFSTAEATLLSKVATGTATSGTIKNRPGSMIFDNGDEAFTVRSSAEGVVPMNEGLMASATLSGFPDGQFYLQSSNFSNAASPIDPSTLTYSFERLTSKVAEGLNARLVLSGIASMLSLEAQNSPELPFSRLKPSASVVPPATDKVDFNGAYGLYFWEIFFHAPLLVAEMLASNQRFEDSKTWLEFIFNPTQSLDPSDPDPTIRFWRFMPFRSMTIESLTEILTDRQQIQVYNDEPFDPDAIASLRTSAYAKATVIRYVNNLIAWADRLFTQDTRETINQATNIYVMAADLLGPRPVEVGKIKTPPAKSYNNVKDQYNNTTVTEGDVAAGSTNSLTLAASASDVNDAYAGDYVKITAGTGSGQIGYIAAYDGATKVATLDAVWSTIPDDTSQYKVFMQGIPQFLIRLENTPTFNSAGGAEYSDVPFNDIDSYFCVPENSELMGLWDQIEDRLFKIRHCMNIHGQERSLALFAPPIDPHALIAAAQAGSGAISILQSGGAGVPLYRFGSVIERAKAYASLVVQFGSSLLAALEKKDAEALSQLRVGQERALQQMATLVKEQQILEAEEAQSALDLSYDAAVGRQTYYQQQVDDGLSIGEQINLASMTLGTIFNVSGSVMRGASAIAYAVPQVGSPFAMTYGGQQLGAAIGAGASVLEGLGMLANFAAQMSITLAQYKRREDEWNLQLGQTTLDIAQIEHQKTSAQAHVDIAKRDLAMHEKSLEQNEEMEAFLSDKFTNEELYQWMSSSLSTLYFQSFSLAMEMARSAQNAYRFEMNDQTDYLVNNHWDAGRKGLLSGEGLMLSLNQMEKSYLDKNKRPLEIEKTVSLRELNPVALMSLVETGECIFELSEKMFDDDFPGHFLRKIVTVSVSIPAVTGPYQNLHATLTQLSNQVVLKPNLDATSFLLGEDGAEVPSPTVLRNNWMANQSVVLSQGMNDTGYFQSSVDDRYLPFEGTGAVSAWRLELPVASNTFDFATVNDVVIHLSYRAVSGGDAFKKKVLSLPAMKKKPLSAYFEMSQRYSSQWYQFMQQPSSTTKQTLSFTLEDLVPPNVSDGIATGLLLKLDLADQANASASQDYITVTLGTSKPVPLTPDKDGNFLLIFPAAPRMDEVEGACSITFDLAKTPSDLKDANTGQLDAEVLRDIGLALSFEGELSWTK
ncbi:neuraminidase-like domain-containing protein [Loktanella agnita]|uniref:Tc toxin subunit A-related protein n=1 Tax=Loktanella agnita TaxID=287097 RepID=UPI0039894141